MFKFLFSFILLTLLSIQIGSLQAQSLCIGPGCSAIPTTEQNELWGQFQFNYMNSLFNDMKSAGLSAALSGYSGVAEIDGAYHIGVSIPAGYKSRHDIWIASPNIQAASPVESAGVAVLPRFEFGYNPKNDKSKLGSKLKSLGRFEFYSSWFSYRYDKKSEMKFNPADGYTLSPVTLTGGVPAVGAPTLDYNKAISFSDSYNLEWKHYGAGLRYRIIEKRKLTEGGRTSWLGLTAAVSILHDRFLLSYLSGKKNTALNDSSGNKIKWQNYTNSQLSTQLNTVPVEIKTGLELFGFFRINTSAGVAWTRGYYSLQTTILGPYTVDSSNFLTSLYLSSNPQTGVLLYNTYRQQNMSVFTPYFKPGIEFKIGPVRIIFEGVLLKKAADTFTFAIAADF